MPLSVDQVLAMAPDAASAAAGRKLSSTKSWSGLGQNDDALWGECKGSAVYQVRVSCADWSYKCSCPSRKFPCKHVLGLMLMAAQDPAALPVGPPPQWIVEWLEKRQATAKARETRQEKKKTATMADPAAAARRAATREKRVADGLERLELWLRDLARNGLAGLEAKPFSFWDSQAASLVDAQAPGLATRVRSLAAIPGSSPDWPVRLAEGLGRTALIVQAYRRLAELSPAMQAEVRSLVRWAVSQDELAAVGEVVEDTWSVLGQVITDEDRLRVQRSWLQGRQTRRAALILQFSAAGAAFAEPIVAGTQVVGKLVFYPGACPQRARIVERGEAIKLTGNAVAAPYRRDADATLEAGKMPAPLKAGEPASSLEAGRMAASPEAGRMPALLVGHDSPETFLSEVANITARNPFIERFLCVLNDVVPVHTGSGQWQVQSGNQALPLAGDGHWRLLALSGGQPVDLAGEWDGHALMPLGVMVGDRYELLPVA